MMMSRVFFCLFCCCSFYLITLKPSFLIIADDRSISPAEIAHVLWISSLLSLHFLLWCFHKIAEFNALQCSSIVIFRGAFFVSPGGEGTPYNLLYGDAPPEKGTFFRLEVCERGTFSGWRYVKRSLLRE